MRVRDLRGPADYRAPMGTARREVGGALESSAAAPWWTPTSAQAFAKAVLVVPRDEGPGRASYFGYDGLHCVGWITINCGPEYVIARAVVERDEWLGTRALRLYPQDPELVLQEAVFRATERADRLLPDASPFRFVEAFMVRFSCELRRERRERTLGDLDELDHPAVESTPLELPEERHELQRLARRLVDELPPAQREAVWLIDLENLTLSQAASRLGKTEDAVSTARRKGRDRLGLPTERLRGSQRKRMDKDGKGR